MSSKPKNIKVCLHKFVDEQWIQISKGQMRIDKNLKAVQIDLIGQRSHYKIPGQYIQKQQQNQLMVKIDFEKIHQIEPDKKDKTIAYFWIEKEPISISFLSEQSCRTMMNALAAQIQIKAVGENNDDYQILDQNYINRVLEDTHTLISNIFISGNINNIGQILKVLKNNHQDPQKCEQDKIKHFEIIKNAIKIADSSVLNYLVEDDNYQFVLKCLRNNPFNDNNYDYFEEYKKIAQFHNALGLDDTQILKAYEKNSKIRFLKDYAICMFSQPDTDRNLNNMIDTNNQTILERFVSDQTNFQRLKKLGEKDPAKFINIIFELWQIFQLICTSYETVTYKDKFWHYFMKHQLHNQIIIAGFKHSESGNPNPRIFQKLISSLNNFMNYDWNVAQQWICEMSSEIFLPELMLKIFIQTTDDSIIHVTLNFAKNLVIPSENRTKIHCKIVSMFFNKFLAKIWPKMQESYSNIQKYLYFMMKIYTIQPIRTRRVLIESRVLQKLDEEAGRNKIVVICVLKLLETLLADQNQDIFRYIRLHKLFHENLRFQFKRNLYSSNMVNSCFKMLLQKIQKSKDKDGQQYLIDIFVSDLND